MSTQVENIRYVFEVASSTALKGLKGINRELDTLSSGFKQLSTASKKFSNAMNTGASATKVFNKALGAFSGVAIGKALAEATKSAVDFYETLNLFQVAMKDSIDTGEQFIANMSEWYGLDPKNLMQYTGMFYEMAYAVNAPDEAARILSTSLTALSVDLASLFNVDVERVADNLTSGMRGMSRAVVKYGLDLRATTVEAYANSLGITEQYETMDEASREILRYLVAVKQARDATGDFARTIESPANQLRVFKEQISQLGRAIGTFLVQPLGQVLPLINGIVMALRIMISTLGALFGFKLDSNFSTGLEQTDEAIQGIGNSAGGAAKQIKSMLAPFDELNVLQENSASGGGGAGGLDYGEIDPRLLEELRNTQYELDAVRMKALDARDAILDFFGFVPTDGGWMFSLDKFEENLKQKLPNWTKSIEAVFDLDWDSITANYYLVMDSIKRIIKGAIDIILQDFGRLTGFQVTDDSLSEWISGLDEKFREFRIWLHENEESISKFVARVAEIGLAFVGLQAVAGFLAPIFGAIGSAFSGVSTAVGFLVSGFGVLMGILTKFSVASTTVSTYLNGFKNALGGLSKGLTVAGSSGTGFVGMLQQILSTLASISGVVTAVGAAMAAVFVGGFVQWMLTSETFKTYLTSWGEWIKNIAIGIRDIFSAVFEALRAGIDSVATNFSSAFEAISAVVDGILQVLSGIIDFVAGVLTGDWKRALKGVYDIWYGAWSAVLNTISAVLNTGISAVNNFLQNVVDAVFAMVNKLLSAIPSVIKSLLGLPSSVNAPTVEVLPQIPVYTPPPFPFAAGGVVTGPTHALIGEAGRDEMVMPLDNSPQMEEFINRIVEKVSGSETMVKVYIGDREWDAFTYESAQRGQRLVGAQPIKEGRA